MTLPTELDGGTVEVIRSYLVAPPRRCGRTLIARRSTR